MIFPFIFSIAATIFVGLAMTYMAYSLLKIGRMVNTGVRTESLSDFVGSRINMVFSIVFGHKKNLEDRLSGSLHMIFMYSFLVLMVGHVEVVLEGMTWFLKAYGREPFLFERLPFLSKEHPLIVVYHLSQEVAAALAMTAGTIALIRRWSGVTPRLMPRTGDHEAILLFEWSLYFAFFIYLGTHHLKHHDFVWHFDWRQPVSSIVALPWTVIASKPTVEFWNFAGWWMHLVIFAFFGMYIPHSKHMHVVWAGPNTFMFRKGTYAWRQPEVVAAEKAKKPEERARAMGLPPKIDFETAEEYGFSRINQIPVQSLLQSVSCTECGRCNDVCPAHLTHKPLKPKKVMRDLKRNLLRHNGEALLGVRDVFGRPVEANKDAEAALELFPLLNKDEFDHDDPALVRPLDGQLNLVDGQIHVDEAWACTTCGACFEACPVLIDAVPGTLIGLRQHLVMTEGEMSSELTNTMKNIERRGNPWGLGQDKRQDWTEGLDVPVFSEIAAETPEREVEYLFWVGCAGATDDNAKRVQQALVRVLKASNVDFAILGCEEKCTGDPARRMGNEMLFNQLAQENIEAMKQYKFKKIFTTCPHCFNSLKNEYGEFGVDFSVQHHTELLQELLKDKRIPLDTKKHLEEHVTFHDPCYLGRYNKQYDAPREVLYAIGGRPVSQGGKLIEMERSKEKSFCCGAGGGRLFMEEHVGERINVVRTEQAVATGATTIAVGCPFCKSMIIDGTKSKDIEEKIKVRDVAELLAERLLPQPPPAE